jgi:hypothetical protein
MRWGLLVAFPPHVNRGGRRGERHEGGNDEVGMFAIERPVAPRFAT